jgi:hypothetical protein
MAELIRELTDQAWLLYRRIFDIKKGSELSVYQTKRLIRILDKAYDRYQLRIKKEHEMC